MENPVLVEYYEFLDWFNEKLTWELPPHRLYDHNIPLLDGEEPPLDLFYRMSCNELLAFNEYIEHLLWKGFIRASSSPAGAPLLFIKKGDGSLCHYVNHHGINEMTIKNRYPLPLIQEMLIHPVNSQMVHQPRPLWCL